MHWIKLFGIVVAFTVMFLYEWPKLHQKKKEKAAFATIALIFCALASLLVVYPELPGPTELVNAIYKPFGNLLEK